MDLGRVGEPAAGELTIVGLGDRRQLVEPAGPHRTSLDAGAT
jgi:hypothetical protein